MTEVTDGTDRGGATAHGTGRMGLGRWNGWGNEAKKRRPDWGRLFSYEEAFFTS